MPLRPGHIKPQVQALPVPVSALIPSICAWYAQTPDSEEKRSTTNQVVTAYNSLIFRFNWATGSTYQIHRPGIIRIWVRCHPTDRAVAPYLHELIILAKAWNKIVPGVHLDDPAALLCAWVTSSFAPGHEALNSL